MAVKRTSIGPGSSEFRVVFKSAIKDASEMKDKYAIDMRLRGVLGYVHAFLNNLMQQVDNSDDVETELAAIDHYIGSLSRPFLYEYHIVDPGSNSRFSLKFRYGIGNCIMRAHVVR